MYKLKEKCPRKFLYKIEGDKNTFLNLLYFVVNTKRKKNVKTGSKLHKKYIASLERLDDFYSWCEKNKISPTNFILNKENYKFTTEKIYNVVININFFGLHWKHLVEENVQNLIVDDVYNFSIKDDVITYSYIKSDFLENYLYIDESFGDEVTFLVDRKTEYLIQDYLQLGFYDFNIKTSYNGTPYTNNGLYNYKIIADSKALQVKNDFFFFYERNKVECPKCKKLVDNAFDDYMIQFYRHDGC